MAKKEKKEVKKKFVEMTLEELRKNESADVVSTLEDGQWKTHVKGFKVNDGVMIYSGAPYWIIKGKKKEEKVM